jgi:peroxiredoxin Q/BCP
MPDTGQPAPDFSLSSTSGQTVALRDLRGRKVVLYFYPKDDTPGCTREACDFRDNLARAESAGAVVYGVSRDSIASHDKFRAKYRLPFELLSDPDHALASKYGAWGEKTLYGKKIVGTIRSTFVIDEKGRVLAKWSPVRVDGHVDKVLEALKAAPAPEAARANNKPAPLHAPKKASVKNRTFAEPKRHKAGKIAGKAAASRASEIGRGYRQASRVKGHATRRGKVK